MTFHLQTLVERSKHRNVYLIESSGAAWYGSKLLFQNSFSIKLLIFMIQNLKSPRTNEFKEVFQ